MWCVLKNRTPVWVIFGLFTAAVHGNRALPNARDNIKLDRSNVEADLAAILRLSEKDRNILLDAFGDHSVPVRGCK